MFKIFRMNVKFVFLDSGTGGLPYLKYLLQKHPDEKCVYIGDTKNFPYGEKTESEIQENALSCVQKIIFRWNPMAVIIACNTISVSSLDILRKTFPKTQFIGTVPAIKPAAQISKTKKIGLLATNATVNHPYTKKLIEDFAGDCEIFSRGDPKLINFIEHKFYSSSESERLEAVLPSVEFFKEKGCDVIVLACTHFLNMAEYFKIQGAPSLKIVDSREGVVKHAFQIEENSLQKNEKNSSGFPNSLLYVTGFKNKNDSLFYKNFCRENKIEFGGILD